MPGLRCSGNRPDDVLITLDNNFSRPEDQLRDVRLRHLVQPGHASQRQCSTTTACRSNFTQAGSQTDFTAGPPNSNLRRTNKTGLNVEVARHPTTSRSKSTAAIRRAGSTPTTASTRSTPTSVMASRIGPSLGISIDGEQQQHDPGAAQLRRQRRRPRWTDTAVDRLARDGQHRQQEHRRDQAGPPRRRSGSRTTSRSTFGGATSTTRSSSDSAHTFANNFLAGLFGLWPSLGRARRRSHPGEPLHGTGQHGQLPARLFDGNAAAAADRASTRPTIRPT